MKSLSARDRVKYAYIPWLIMIGLTVLTFFLIINPLLQERSEKQKTITIAQKKLDQLEEERESLTIEVKELKNKFEKAAGETLIKEKKTLPPQINTDRIAQALELFAIELNNFDLKENSVLKMKNISFSKPKENKELQTTETSTRITFEATNQNIPHVINFIQKGIIPIQYQQEAENNSALINNNNYQFIKKHGIPIGTIQKIQSTLQKNKNAPQEIFEVNIQAIFYSEK